MEVRGHIVGWAMIFFIPVIILLGYRNNNRLFGILILAWLARVLFAVYNTYIHSAYVDDFESSAFSESTYGLEYVMQGLGSNARLYTWFCSMIYLVVGRSPLLLQGINILLGVLIVSNCYKLTEQIYGERAGLWAAGVLALFPSSAMFGTLILRESVWIYPATVGALWWTKGIKENRLDWLVGAGVPFLISYAFHAGALGLLLAWACTPVANSLAANRGNLRQVLVSIVTLVVVFMAVLLLLDSGLLLSLNEKFDLRNLSADDIGSSLEIAARNRTAYLTDLSIRNSTDLIWQLPIRFVYFLGTPFPWSIATVLDGGGFLDALFYLISVGIILRNWRALVRNPAAIALFLACLFTWGIFSVGTSNYGTAMRHRAKMAPFLCVLVCGAWHFRNRGPFGGMVPPRMMAQPAKRVLPQRIRRAAIGKR